MTVTKTVLARLDKCYATAAMEIAGRLRYIIATEGVGPCVAFSDADRSMETVWEGPGGTMNIVPIPGVPRPIPRHPGFRADLPGQGIQNRPRHLR